MKISLIIPIFEESRRPGLKFEKRLVELDAFFQRLPVIIETIFVVDPGKDESFSVIENFNPTFLKVKSHLNQKRQGRSLSIKKGLQMATGDLAILYSMDFSIPFAELFAFIQEFVTQPQTRIAFGDRSTAKKKRTGQRTSWQFTLENLVREKARGKSCPLNDPLCSLVGIRKDIIPDLLKITSWQGWYFAIPLAQAAQQLDIAAVQLPVLSRDTEDSRAPLVREFFRFVF